MGPGEMPATNLDHARPICEDTLMSKKPRRKRWTVRFEDGGEPAVILAYDALEARGWYEGRKGRLVASVTEGDYRALTRSPSGAKPIESNVAEAMAFLGLKLEADITLSNRAQFQRGMYRSIPMHPFLCTHRDRIFGGDIVTASEATWKHTIRLTASQDAEEMGKTLWHELTHAMQFERDMLPHDGTVHDVLVQWRAMYRDGTSYASKPYEVEANNYMQHNKELPLAR